MATSGYAAVSDLAVAASNETAAVRAAADEIGRELSELNGHEDAAVRSAVTRISSHLGSIVGASARLDAVNKRVLAPGASAVPTLAVTPNAPVATEEPKPEVVQHEEHYEGDHGPR
jgi:hypothetical protein